MKTTAEKNMKQRTFNHPISIRLILKIALILLGYSVFGMGFIWALVGLYFFFEVLRGILSCLITLGAIIAFVIVILTFL